MTLFLETLHLLRDELGVNTTCGAGNTSFGLPGRHTLGAAFLAVAQSHGLTSAIMDSRRPEMVEAVRATDFLLGRDEWGAAWIARTGRSRGRGARERARRPPGAPHPDRVRLRFLQSGEDRAVKEARVLAGTTIFDAASWNGVAIDSTCGGHGTCKKCKVQGRLGARAESARSIRARSRVEELKAGWRLACRARRAGGPDDRGAAAADAAEGCARRRRAARDPATGGAEALRRARRSRRSRTRRRISSACSRRWTTSSCACRSTSCATSAARCAARLEGDRRARRRRADRRRAGRHDRPRGTRSRSISARRRSSRRCSTSRPASRRRCSRS